MADIFADTQPPAWLQAETRQTPGLLGDVGGLALGGALNALQRDPNAPKDASFLASRKGLKEGLTEARLNEADPLWKVKLSQIMVSEAQKQAQATSTLALANERLAETAAWMKDAPALSGWLTARPEDRANMPTPVAASKQGLSLIEKANDVDAKYAISKSNQDIRLETSRIQLENQKRSADWQNAVGGADPETQSAIAELPNQGWVIDGKGQRIAPSSQALGLLNTWRKANSLLPFGAKQTEVVKPDAVTVEKEKQKGRMEMQVEKGKEKEAFEQQRQKDRKEIEQFKADSKIDIEKLKLSAKDSKGKVVDEETFTNKHLLTLAQMMVKQQANPNVEQALANATKALRSHYRLTHIQAPTAAPAAAPAASAPATTGTNQPPAAAASTNAPATNSDPLGLFK